MTGRSAGKTNQSTIIVKDFRVFSHWQTGQVGKIRDNINVFHDQLSQRCELKPEGWGGVAEGLECFLASGGPELDSLLYVSWAWWHRPEVPACNRWMQEDQKLKIGFSYLGSLRSAQDSWETLSQNKSMALWLRPPTGRSSRGPGVNPQVRHDSSQLQLHLQQIRCPWLCWYLHSRVQAHM